MILHRHHPSSLRSLRRQHWIKWLQITTVFLWSLFPPFYTPAPAAYTPDSQSPPQPVWDRNGDEPESGPDLSDDDSDGLPNWFEQWLGSDVGNPDSDYDGLSDADEQYLTGTDPINWDTNSDGYSDHDAFYNCWAVNHHAVGFGQSVYDWDGDGTYNPQDPWPFDPNNGSYDPSTSDSDGDGYADANDSHPYDYSIWGDWGTDGDSGGDPDGDPDPGEGDPEPTDDDADDDGFPDGQDSDPTDPTLWDDANRNGINDSAEVDPYTHDSDNDGFVDALDSNPWDPVLWTDWNSNNQNDHDETSGTGTYDYDDDGVNDSNDSHPLDSTLWADWNNNNQHDPEELDSDGDTVSDLEDTDPHNSALWNDHNRNGINDDDNDPLSIDTDLDGVPDVRDSHPYSDQLWIDFNDNGFNDDHPTDDLDGDSHSNETDSHPSNSDLWEDWDNDGINDSDSGGGGGSDDSDSDNYPNHLDSHPEVSTLWSDWDFDSLNLDDEMAHQTDSERPDTDQDGLTDGEEVSYSTNPTLWDTDNDGLSDFEELRGTFGSNPRDAYSLSKNRGWGSLYDDWQMASLVDTDLDGIPNRIEELYGLNPNNPQDAASDLDGDGITNRIAYQQGRALIAIVTPLDRDGDGLTDAQEDFWGRRNPGLLSKFNPQDAVKDPDNDDLMNWQEVQFNSNPGIAVSTPHGKIGNVNDGTIHFWQSLIQSNSSYHFLALTRLPQGYQDSINDWMDTDYNPDANGSPTITPPGLQAFLSTVSPIHRLPGRKAPSDYDGDGMPDQWEWRYRQKLSTLDSADAGTPNQTPTLKQDPDSDALSNLAEFQLNTHPLLPDTDGDGFADGLEVQHGSSPTQVTSLPPLSLTVISGNSQTALVDTIATQPLIVATRRITTPVPSTPVTFTVSHPTAGQLSTSPNGPWTSTVSTTSSSTGNAQVYWKAPVSPGNSVVTAVSPSHPTISPVNFSLAATNLPLPPPPPPSPPPPPPPAPALAGTMVWNYSEKSMTVQAHVSEDSMVLDSGGNWQPPNWVARLNLSYTFEDGELGGRMIFDPPISFYEVRAGSPLATVKHENGASGETSFTDYLLTAQSHYLNQNMVFGPHSPTGDVFADDKQDISRFVNERQMRWVVQGGVLSESQSRSFLVKCATKSYAQGAPPEEIKYFPVSFRANAGLEAGTLASVEISNPGPAATHGIRVAGQTLVLQPPMVANQRTVLSLLPIDLATDLNNDGQITSADSSLRDAATKSGASDADKEKGTEYLFINDKMSNGVWDADDAGVMSYSYGSGYSTMPKPPATHKDDDDAESLKVQVGGLNTGIVWFDHPVIEKLEFFKTKECKEIDKFNITSSSPYDLGNEALPETIYIRPRDDWAGVDAEGEGILHMFVGKTVNQTWAELKLPLTVVRDFGAKHFFHAARDYIAESNTQLCIRDVGYPLGPNPSVVFRLCIMREEATQLVPVNALSAGNNGIDQVYLDTVGSQNKPAVIINGSQCFFSAGWQEPVWNDPSTWGDLQNMIGKIADKCHGRLIRSGATAAMSSDNFDITTKPAAGSPLAGPDPIPAGLLAGPDGIAGNADDIPNSYAGDPGGKYVGYNSGSWAFAAGQPASADAVGGLSTNYTSLQRTDKAHQLMGYAKGTEQGKGCVFTATQIKGEGYAPIFKADASLSGVPAMTPSVDSGAIKLLILDSGAGSLALMHTDPAGAMQSAYIGRKSELGVPYYVNNYLALYPSRPRQ